MLPLIVERRVNKLTASTKPTNTVSKTRVFQELYSKLLFLFDQSSFIAVACLIAVCRGSVVPAQRLVAGVVPAVAVTTDIDPSPQYAFAYNIHDTLTGDQKSQQESRDGDLVRGIST